MPDTAGNRRGDANAAVGNITGLRRHCVGRCISIHIQLTRLRPALSLGFKGSLLPRFEVTNGFLIAFQKLSVILQAQGAGFDAQIEATFDEILAHLQQLGGAHRIETNLIKEAQQPLPALLEVLRLTITIPHLHGASDKLIAARPFHTVHTQISATNAHGIFRCPGARRVVLGGHQSMPWIEWRCHRRTQIHITETHHQITGFKHDAMHVLNTGESVDAPDELDIAGTPGCIGAYRLHVLVDRQLRCRVVP